MTLLDSPFTSEQAPFFGLHHLPVGAHRVYAIAFDMDIEALRQNYGDPYNKAYAEIKKILVAHGFLWQQGSVYFGDDKINAVTCVLAAIDLAQKLPWFTGCVRDIRMLRIEELNDLMPAVQNASRRSRK
jgi:virulence-associated protein VapD